MFVLTYEEFVIFTLIFILGTQFIVVIPLQYYVKRQLDYVENTIEDLRHFARRQDKAAGATKDAEV